MRWTRSFVVIAAFLFAWPMSSQNACPVSPNVKTTDVLSQLDAVILSGSLNKKTPEETLSLVESMLTLNKLQIDIAGLRDSEKNGKPALFGSAADYNQTFYNLRASVCKRYSGMVVDLDGTLRRCN
jgi:hypothetical protein